jgi:hypothetical protein
MDHLDLFIGNVPEVRLTDVSPHDLSWDHLGVVQRCFDVLMFHKF